MKYLLYKILDLLEPQVPSNEDWEEFVKIILMNKSKKKKSSGLRISPISHGQHDNIWFNVKNGSLTMKITGFYDTGLAYIQKTVIRNPNLDKAANFKRIKEKLADRYDFEIVTPFEEAFKKGVRFENTKALLDSLK